MEEDISNGSPEEVEPQYDCGKSVSFEPWTNPEETTIVAGETQR